MSNKYVDFLYSLVRRPKRLVKFSGRWVDSDLPFPRSSNTFFANISKSEVQLLFGISNFITEDVKALSILSISPQKVVELRDFLNTVLSQYDTQFGVIDSPPEDPNSPSSTSGTLIH